MTGIYQDIAGNKVYNFHCALSMSTPNKHFNVMEVSVGAGEHGDSDRQSDVHVKV
jgi:hypothetical protein